MFCRSVLAQAKYAKGQGGTPPPRNTPSFMKAARCSATRRAMEGCLSTMSEKNHFYEKKAIIY